MVKGETAPPVGELADLGRLTVPMTTSKPRHDPVRGPVTTPMKTPSKTPSKDPLQSILSEETVIFLALAVAFMQRRAVARAVGRLAKRHPF